MDSRRRKRKAKMTSIPDRNGNPLICCYSDCQKRADDAFNSAPVFVRRNDGAYAGHVYVHCSLEHLMATMATNPDFSDVQATTDYGEYEPEGECPLCGGTLYGLYPSVCNRCGCEVNAPDE